MLPHCAVSVSSARCNTPHNNAAGSEDDVDGSGDDDYRASDSDGSGDRPLQRGLRPADPLEEDDYGLGPAFHAAIGHHAPRQDGGVPLPHIDRVLRAGPGLVDVSPQTLGIPPGFDGFAPSVQEAYLKLMAENVKLKQQEQISYQLQVSQQLNVSQQHQLSQHQVLGQPQQLSQNSSHQTFLQPFYENKLYNDIKVILVCIAGNCQLACMHRLLNKSSAGLSRLLVNRLLNNLFAGLSSAGHIVILFILPAESPFAWGVWMCCMAVMAPRAGLIILSQYCFNPFTGFVLPLQAVLLS